MKLHKPTPAYVPKENMERWENHMATCPLCGREPQPLFKGEGAWWVKCEMCQWVRLTKREE